MTDAPSRVVDAHVHLWDPARTDWYPYLSRPGREGGGSGIGGSGMYRRFDADTYRAESSRWNVEKFVNVAAATGPNSIDETLELDHPARRNGAVPPPSSVDSHRPRRWRRRSHSSTARWRRRASAASVPWDPWATRSPTAPSSANCGTGG